MIELLVVATIIIVLTTIGLVSFRSANQNARNGKRRADLETVRQALVLYRTDEGEYPAASGTSNGNFTTMISTISDYLSVTTLNDPQNVAPFQYTYTSSGTNFTVCAYLEPSPGTQYCLTNP